MVCASAAQPAGFQLNIRGVDLQTVALFVALVTSLEPGLQEVSHDISGLLLHLSLVRAGGGEGEGGIESMKETKRGYE